MRAFVRHIALVCCFASALRMDAAIFSVTTTADSGVGSLRQAISNANANLGADTITCTSISGTILLNAPLPEIGDTASVIGPGQFFLTISGGNSNRVLQIGSGATVTIRGTTIANGYVTNGGGAGILNNGNLTATDCTIISNVVVHGDGGGVFNQGVFNIINSRVVANRATDGVLLEVPNVHRVGGGLYSYGGSIVVSNCIFETNWVGGGRSIGTVPIAGEARGGAIFFNGSQIDIIDSILLNNAVSGAGGYNTSPFSRYGQNGAPSYGGGIFLSSGLATLTRCTLSGNQAFGGRGESRILSGGYGGSAEGGGIFSRANCALVNCTLSGNSVQGGAGGSPNGSGGDVIGGAASASQGDLSLVSCTVYQNSAIGGLPGSGGRAGYGSRSGIYGTSNSVRLLNTILQFDSGQFTSQGHNLLTGISSSNPTDQSTSVLSLGPLQNNGGPTPTHALPTESLAIDRGTSVGVPAFDQRGVARPSGSGFDIGAFELQQNAPLIGAISPDQAMILGTSNALYVHSLGAPRLNYQWERNGTRVASGTNDILIFPRVTDATAGFYRVVVTNAYGAATSALVQITILYPIQLTNSGGSVIRSPFQQGYAKGQIVTLTATTNFGWQFLQWLGDASGMSGTTSVQVLDKPLCITAVFGTSIVIQTNGNGTVLVDPPGPIYPYGSLVRLTAVPELGSYFSSWGFGGVTNPVLLRIQNPLQVVSCSFDTLGPGEAALAVISSGKGRAVISPDGNRFVTGANVQLTAIPEPGQRFTGWSGDALATNHNTSLVLDATKVIIANFTRSPRLFIDACGCGFGPDGFRLHLSGEFGVQYEVEISGTLSDWEPLLTVTNSFGISQFTDPHPMLLRRFYRAVAPP